MTDSSQVQALRQRYKSSLTDKAEAIEWHLNELRVNELGDGGSADQNKLVDAREMLHKLAGSSGMYGYDDIAVLCREAMNDVDQTELPVLLKRLEKIKELLEQHA